MTRVVTRLLKAGSLRSGDLVHLEGIVRPVDREGIVKAVHHVSSAMVIVTFADHKAAFDASYFLRVTRSYPQYVKET